MRYTRVNMLQLHHRRRPSFPRSMGRIVGTQRIVCRTKCLYTNISSALERWHRTGRSHLNLPRCARNR